MATSPEGEFRLIAAPAFSDSLRDGDWSGSPLEGSSCHETEPQLGSEGTREFSPSVAPASPWSAACPGLEGGVREAADSVRSQGEAFLGQYAAEATATLEESRCWSPFIGNRRHCMLSMP